MQHQSEFFSAITRRGIDGARMVAQHFAQPHDRAASRQMPILIVDGFQPIHIQQNHAERTLRPPRTVQLRFHPADQPPVIRQAGQRIADRHGPHLIEQPRLIQQRAGQHDDVTRDLAQFRQEERPVKQLPRERRGHVANHVERSHRKQRVVVDSSRAFAPLRILQPLAEEDCCHQKQRPGKQIPWTRQQTLSMRYWTCRRSQERRAGHVRCDGHDKQRSSRLFARLPGRRHEPLDRQRREQNDCEQRQRHHPPHRHTRKRTGTGGANRRSPAGACA